jgi:hypothetical protein
MCRLGKTTLGSAEGNARVIAIIKFSGEYSWFVHNSEKEVDV